MSYGAWRHAHIGLVVLSLALFAIRGVLSLSGVDWRRRWPVLRWLPHGVDTLLLLAGLVLVMWSGQVPWVHHWLAVKLLLLVAYVACGREALRLQRSRASRASWFTLSVVLAAGMVGVAVTRGLFRF
jgi:uncharacterized membrane protein SirB2